MGFLSTVPDNAGDLMKAAVAAASNANGNFPGTHSEPLCHRIADSLPSSAILKLYHRQLRQENSDLQGRIRMV